MANAQQQSASFTPAEIILCPPNVAIERIISKTLSKENSYDIYTQNILACSLGMKMLQQIDYDIELKEMKMKETTEAYDLRHNRIKDFQNIFKTNFPYCYKNYKTLCKKHSIEPLYVYSAKGGIIASSQRMKDKKQFSLSSMNTTGVRAIETRLRLQNKIARKQLTHNEKKSNLLTDDSIKTTLDIIKNEK